MNNENLIGCSTYCCMDLALEDALESLSQRTHIVEILSDANHNLFYHVDVCHSFDLYYTVHSPCSDINIASVNEPIRQGSIQVLKEISSICDDIGAKTLVIHPGFVDFPNFKDRSHSALVKSLHELAELQPEREVRLAIENMGYWDVCHFRGPALLSLIDALDLGFVLDVGHAYLSGCLDAFLEQAKPVHVHLHDNSGLLDEHSACGSCSIDFRHVLDNIPADATTIVEVTNLDDAEESLRYLGRLMNLEG
jgi:sugar phosphate isomerase/epimerase